MKFSPQEVPKLVFAEGQEDVLGESSAYNGPRCAPVHLLLATVEGNPVLDGWWLQPAPAH